MHLGKQWKTDQMLGPAPMVETWMNLPASNPGPALANEPMDRYDLCVCLSLSLPVCVPGIPHLLGPW